MREDLHVAVVGATGAVGIDMLKTLEKRNFPVGKLSPLASALHTVFPNPTRGTATLRYDLAESGPASVRVYDAVGRHVLTLADGLLAAGAHEASLDASPLPAGVYLVRLTTATAAHTQSLVVVR